MYKFGCIKGAQMDKLTQNADITNSDMVSKVLSVRFTVRLIFRLAVYKTLCPFLNSKCFVYVLRPMRPSKRKRKKQMLFKNEAKSTIN